MRKTTPKLRQPTKLEQEFASLYSLCCKDLPPPTREHRFHETRRWRFDFAWVQHKVAVEMEGGVFQAAGHRSTTNFVNDCEKYNAAALLGWRVLRYTRKCLEKRPAQVVEELRAALTIGGTA